MKQIGVKQVRGGQLSACYKTKAEHLAEWRAELKQLEAQLEVAKTQPPSDYGVTFIESRIKNIKQYLRAKTRK